MRTSLVLLIGLWSAALVGQNNFVDNRGLKQGSWKKTYENGRLRYEGTFKDDIPVGTFTYYYEVGGGKMSEINYRGTSGIGYSKAFHRNGNLLAEGKYSGQQKDSVWTYYDPQGTLTQHETYLAGVLNGPQITYYENGKPAEILTFENGVEQGPWVRKWDDGKLRTKGTYENGVLEGECTYYDASGSLIAKGSYHNSKKHGTWYYLEENKVVRKEVYRYGKLEEEVEYGTETEE